MDLTDKEIRYDKLYMDIATRVSEMSYDSETKVGAVLVKEGNIISMGWNGTPSGFDNECKAANGSTHPYVIHAEANALCKLAKTNGNGEGATLYTTVSPCIECTKLILQSGVSEVVIQQCDTRYMDGYKILNERKMIRLWKSTINN